MLAPVEIIATNWVSALKIKGEFNADQLKDIDVTSVSIFFILLVVNKTWNITK